MVSWLYLGGISVAFWLCLGCVLAVSRLRLGTMVVSQRCLGCVSVGGVMVLS